MSKALARALAAEYAAVYAYGVIGARTSGNLRLRANAGFDAHRARRDQLRTLIIQRGEKPEEPAPTYQLPFEVATPAQAVRLAAQIEDGVLAAYLELAADPDPGLRQLAAQAMQECALRGYGWRPAIPAFPGMPAAAQGGPTPGVTDPTPVPPATIGQ
ncbi:hypothetical protein Aph01nite_26010 [Acrocarpospora phusangensis]|uniref:DUF4439 domain-containing protein n=1 Tax=Acrocarpospora phusangensis TaxID=1070424 RepID=A0A919QA68_9ACTN|nr:ferritin-like domain-containing protein [Acrocarpospora phusangensis]GIH24291.1 hypothetical protein Aph01nite_26010 [Acrocarpospora phusangensis]